MDVDPGTIFPRTKVGRDHQMRDLFRAGKVIERKIDEKLGPLVRVQYLDKQGLISKWLPIKQPGARLTMMFQVPKIGNDVNVTMLPNGSEDGFVDGSFYNEKNPPPAGIDIDTRHFETEDKTIIEYREIDSTFLLDASAATNGGAKAAGGGSVLVKGGVCTVTVPAITLDGTGGTVLVKAGTITLEGPMEFKGDITHTGNMVTSGTHTDSVGPHYGGATRDDLEARLAALEERVLILEQKLAR
jgi:phage baseplate assembly protein V